MMIGLKLLKKKKTRVEYVLEENLLGANHITYVD
jgi:hypothetical protein